MIELLKMALDKDASDVHVRCGRPPQLRINGRLRKVKGPPTTDETLRRFIFSMLEKDQIDRFERTLDLDFSCAIDDLCRLRVNVFYQRGQMAAALRIVPDHIPTMEDLYLPSACHSFVHLSKGLVLVTGPSGSGKSTTLASMIDYINSTRDCHILTIEDPIEFLYGDKMAIVSQREVTKDTRAFSSALRHSLRQDPDVILIGEMRDLETIQTAITLAETGHVTFSTLHTGEASQTISRMIDSFPPHQQNQIRAQVSVSLEGIISQQLLPLKGKTGRVAAREALVCTPAVKNMIRENKLPQIRSAIQTGLDVGMISMNYSLGHLYEKGVIEYEVALRASFNKKAFSEKYGADRAPVAR